VKILRIKLSFMKKQRLLISGMVAMIVFAAIRTEAQDEKPKSSFVTGADFFSNYIWRGTKFGNGPAIQPSVKFVTGGLAVGVWGSFDASGYMEADPFISYSFPFGLSLGVTDYYYPNLGGSFFADSSNAYELNLGYTYKGLSLSANYIVNEAPIPASSGSDLYFQAGYAFKKFNVSIGAGDGWHTANHDFNVCHIAVGTGKTIEITDKFSVPVTGQVILNPDKKQLFVVVGFSL
jgi:uncharacterized protein (TIGR02001 family)